jgi:hypothetical protein
MRPWFHKALPQRLLTPQNEAVVIDYKLEKCDVLE